MKRETAKLIETFVNENITSFHENRIANLKKLELHQVLKNKNPYLFKAKNIDLGSELMDAILDARLSSSEEGSFGGFLENLATFVAEKTGGGSKSGIEGIDIELIREKVRYLIAVKSGKNWGNSQAQAALKLSFKRAVKVIHQSKHAGELMPTLGICYGNFRTNHTGEFLHIGGQDFWKLISGDSNFYVDIVEPIGYKAKEHDAAFKKEKSATYNRLIREFLEEFCATSGAIDWTRLVQFVSENIPRPAGRARSRK